MTSRILKGTIKLIILIRRINWVKFFQLYNKQSKNVLWIPKKRLLLYLISDSVLWDTATINAFIEKNKSFKVFYGYKIGTLSNKNIFHTVNNALNVFGFANYPHVYQHVMSQLEVQGNTLYPNSHEVSFWENKGYMHEQFKKLRVSEPLTTLLPVNEKIDTAQFTYPFLVKTEHSCSAKGVFKIANIDEFESLVSSKKFKLENRLVIKQQLVNMRRDLRVTLVGNEIVHHYWRINLADEWKPTSTSYGSCVDFGNFPEQWRKHILDTFKKLQLSAGAFDITWQGDNLDSEPLYLEVSPVFQPNPNIELKGKEYAYYKKSFSPFNPFDKAYVDLIFDIKLKMLQFNLTSLECE